MAAAYTVAGRLGLELAYETSSVTAIWAPTGIALAAILLGGSRLWPGVALGALLTNVDTGVPAGTVLGITCGNTLEALCGAYLLRRVAGFRPSLRRVRDVLWLVVLGAVVSTTVSATIGVASLLIGDAVTWGDAASTWRTWWLGDMGGDLIVAPALLVALTQWPLRQAPGRGARGVVLGLALAGVSVLVFSQGTNLAYAVFPFLIWAALRFWQPGAAAASLIVAVVAVAFTANGKGPFASGGPDERLLLAQTFVAVGGDQRARPGRRDERARAGRGGHARDRRHAAGEPGCPGPCPRARIALGGVLPSGGRGAAGRRRLLRPVRDRRRELGARDRGRGGQGTARGRADRSARYTLRAAAVREHRPSRILASLNEAVWREQEIDAICTALYTTVDVNGATARLTLASGGHPLPLVLRADGCVEQIGHPGTLLGIDAKPLLADRTCELALRRERALLHRRPARRVCAGTCGAGIRPRIGPRLVRRAPAVRDRRRHRELLPPLRRTRAPRRRRDRRAAGLGLTAALAGGRDAWHNLSH